MDNFAADWSYLEKRTSVLLQLGLRPQVLPALKKYLQLLWSSNQEHNFISRKMSFAELIDNHVIDCLLPLPHFPSQARKVADLGSGGGLPAVLYALQFPDVEFVLFEKSKVKQQFLQSCQKLAPALKIAGEIPVAFPAVDLVMARAFKPLDVLLQMTRGHLERGGSYFLLKATPEKITEELSLATQKFPEQLASMQIKTLPLHSPVLEVQRNLLWLGKS